MPKSNELYMHRAMELALMAKGKTSPNPMVGAVIVKNDRIIGEGYHKKAGTPHAEINALNSLTEDISDATMYINLEPCCHYGRTPPCTQTLIKNGLKNLVVGMLDPNPLVGGKGINELKNAGINVETGVLEKECKKLNEIYIKYITTRKPFVLLKSSITLDGKIATCTKESKWITGKESRELVHQLREEIDAIMVGIGTVINDNPNLTAYLKADKIKDPVKIIVDSKLRIPSDANVFKSDSKVIIATTAVADIEKIKILQDRKVDVLVIEEQEQRVNLVKLMEELGKKEITYIMLEGGAEINASALKSNIVDKVMFFIAPKILGGQDSISAIGGKGCEKLTDAFNIHDLNVFRTGNDIVIEGYIDK